MISAMCPAPPSFIIVTISTLFWAVAKAIESFKKKVAERSIGKPSAGEIRLPDESMDQQVPPKHRQSRRRLRPNQ